ncbi:MAG TPA: MgtC/SapB family protein [Solirubrobacteraceae bacterium]|jgi:putative Mg2+ transporter-C (MgtC) family protein
MRATSVSDGEIVLRLAIIVVLCGAIGLERQARDEIAGLRTHVIVGLGAGLFTLVSAYGFAGSNASRVDPSRIAAQVVSGIGFLGAGVIIRNSGTVRGVTTAAALWISAAIGMAIAAGFYLGGAATTGIALVALVALRRLRPVVRRRFGSETLSLELDLARGASVSSLLDELRRHRLRVEGLESEIRDDGTERLRLEMLGPGSLDVDSILFGLSNIGEIARIERAALYSFDLDAGEEPSPRIGNRLHIRRFYDPNSSTRSATESTMREAR